MVLFGISGILSKFERITLTSIMILIMGIITIILGAFSINNPIYVAIIIGICLIIEGVALILSD